VKTIIIASQCLGVPTISLFEISEFEFMFTSETGKGSLAGFRGLQGASAPGFPSNR